MALKRFYLRVYGYVQGVGFRHFALRLAKSMGISGWVRNLNDGSVELEAEGPKESIENFVNRVSEGPPYAIIKKITKEERPPEGSKDFEIRF
ncbi:MAG TPA: acylphosphatase [Candidatus Hydrothermia bacterium]|nr:acylphosphatase [Candidatus Hydrothermae bacterium]MDD3649525.1 acylphosphatase [Candidatus Hydrothermia bacterium]MDD5572283.1 acylphosphatase [Candidatus Hydrothermia bacterium]HOK23426.1 acylphosphatase [Candidatus Hydrothermia bacterium]HOL23978.1 acylphosphatase [Candidatus Hydrothermia bacterium]